MEHNEYETMYALENDYWWFVARRRIVTAFVEDEVKAHGRGRIFDVGCGTGANLEALSRYGESFGIDISGEAIRLCRRRGLNDLSISRLEDIGCLSESFDLITALDVLEHVDDDLPAIRELYRICKQNGLLLVTVPAYGFLWSEHDEALHHRRRYSAYELRNKLTLAGFEIERCTYFITTLFLPILLVRIFQGIFKSSTQPKTSHIQLPAWLNLIIVGLLAFEQQLVKYINFPFGVSILCTARKPKTAVEEIVDRNSVADLGQYPKTA